MPLAVSKSGDDLLPTTATRARYGVSDMTIFRWLADPKLCFPQPIRINGRRYWRLADLPWLQAKVQRKIFGDAYQPMQRDYLIEEYLEDCVPSRVVASVFVQANWPSQNSLEEVAWVQSVADRHDFPQAIVGYVDLSDPDRERLIDQQLKFANLRGIRQQIFWHQFDASYRFGARSDLMKDRHWRSGMELLADRNLPFELQVFPEQMDDAADLARDNPRTQFVLVHAGMLENVSTEGWQAWRQGMQKLAACNMTAMDVAAAIASQNLDAPIGQVGQPPAPPGKKRSRGRPRITTWSGTEPWTNFSSTDTTTRTNHPCRRRSWLGHTRRCNVPRD